MQLYCMTFGKKTTRMVGQPRVCEHCATARVCEGGIMPNPSFGHDAESLFHRIVSETTLCVCMLQDSISLLGTSLKVLKLNPDPRQVPMGTPHKQFIYTLLGLTYLLRQHQFFSYSPSIQQ
jgi:hypothetical protein